MKKIRLLLLAISSFAFGDAQQEQTQYPSDKLCHGFSHLYVTGDFIYWKARQEELNSIATFSIELGTERVVDLKVHDIDFRYCPGFKLGLGGNLPFDGWDLYVNWTHLHNHTQSTRTSPNHDLVNVESLGQQEASFAANHARVSYDLMFNSIDFEWGRRYFVSDTWSIRPAFGGKTFWIHQTFRYNFENVQTIPLPNLGVLPGFPEVFKAKNDFWGIGPYFSFEGKWVFGWGIGLLGKISGAVVWGSFDQTSNSVENELDTGGGGPPSVTRSRVTQTASTHRIRPTAQMFIGVDWERCFIPNRLGMQLTAGYEVQYFWGQIYNVRDLEETDLSLEGLTMRARLDF